MDDYRPADPMQPQSQIQPPFPSPALYGDAVLVCDARGAIGYANQAAGTLIGRDARTILGSPLDQVLQLRQDDGKRLDWARISRRAKGKSAAPRRIGCRLERMDGSAESLQCEVIAGNALVVVVLIAERASEKDAEALAHRANHDALTGLPNRAALQTRLDLIHRNARNSGGKYGLLLLDLDHFKVINDRFGHPVGDRTLSQIGQRLVEIVRDHDIIGRWGGEEFLCLLPQVGRDKAAEIAERIRAGVEAVPVEHEKRRIRVTTSIGAVAFPDDGDNPETLLAKADSALYEAKRSGRNRVRCHTEASGNVFALAHLIEHALSEDRVRPAFQPIVDLATGEVRAEEGFARIRRPDGDWLTAARFIPAAEQLNLVHRVDHRIIQCAIRRCVDQTLHQDTPPPTLFMNFSADLLRHRELVTEIVETVKQQCALCEHQLGADKPLVAEITERQFLRDIDEAKQVLEPFLELGLRLAIDDFGTGHCTLKYLTELPVAFIKIEGALVRRITTEPRVRSAVQGIGSLANDLDAVTVAEGIEDEATADLLRRMGIDWGQGFLFGRPKFG